MRAAVYRQPGEIGLENRTDYQVGDDELLVRVNAASICGTDLRIFKNGHFKIPTGMQRVLGHELAGEIVEAGKLVNYWRPGMRVCFTPNIGCGHCEMCRQGYNNMCPDYEAFGISLDGGFQDYLKVPGFAIRGGNVFEIPDHLSFEEAALIEPLSCCFNAFKGLDVRPGDTVLIVGPGPIGANFAMLSRAAGASKVIVAGRSSQRLEAIRAFGADVVVNTIETDLKTEIERITGGRGVDVVVTAASAPELQPLAIELLATHGRVNFFGGLPKGTKVEIDSNRVHYRGLRVLGTTGSSNADYAKSLQLVADGVIQVGKLVSERFSLSEINKAFDFALSGAGMKAIVAAS